MGSSSVTVERETVCDACAGRTLGVCHVLGQADRTRLLDCGSVRRYEPGGMLACEGEPARFVFSVADGAVMLFKLLSDGRRQVISFLFRGDFIGLTFGSDYAFAAQALTPVQTCRFPRRPFQALLSAAPALEGELLSRASDELRAAQDHLLLLGRKTAKERVCSFLLHFADRQQAAGGSPDQVFLPMTRGDMADYLGLTTETVSRIMSDLRRRRIVANQGSLTVRLLRRDYLETQAFRT